MTHQELKTRVEALKPVLAIDEKREGLLRMREESLAPNLWDNQEYAAKLLADISTFEALLHDWDSVMSLVDEEISDQVVLELLRNEIERLERVALLSGPHDTSSAILSIHAGTGGTDAQDWAEMLERMYLRYIEKGKTESVEMRALGLERLWSASIVDRSTGEEAGIKSVTIEVNGRYAYGLLKGEAGVHRLVRLSPFNAKNLRQTSFALVEVIPEVEKSTDVQINEADLQVDVFRSGGAGGQHVNTTDSAVRLTHKPTGIVVAVQNERSQHQNKASAMKILASKLARLEEAKSAEEQALLKGEFREGTWGNQIRSYVLQPYQMVKDHRTETETSNVQAVLDGDLKLFIESNLTKTPNE